MIQAWYVGTHSSLHLPLSQQRKTFIGHLPETNQILFLNKEDLFKAKIAQSPIRRFFPDYEGAADDVEAGKAYFQKRFLRIERKGALQLQQLAKPGGDSKGVPSSKPSGAHRRQIYPQ